MDWVGIDFVYECANGEMLRWLSQCSLSNLLANWIHHCHQTNKMMSSISIDVWMTASILCSPCNICLYDLETMQTCPYSEAEGTEQRDNVAMWPSIERFNCVRKGMQTYLQHLLLCLTCRLRFWVQFESCREKEAKWAKDALLDLLSLETDIRRHSFECFGSVRGL